MSQLNEAITNVDIQVERVYSAQNEAFGEIDYPFLVEFITQNNSQRILDIGTGEGSFLFGLASRVEHVKFEAVEYNEKLINKAKTKNEELGFNIDFHHANFGENFSGSNYDLIMARFAVEHISSLGDIDTLVANTFKALKPNGWLVIIEYYIHDLNIIDPVWKKFRNLELRTYKTAKIHNRVALQLPESFIKSNYKNITSTINHISPSTIDPERFYELVIAYTELYAQVAPKIWSNKTKEEILAWCEKKQPLEEPILFTSYTIGQKQAEN